MSEKEDQPAALPAVLPSQRLERLIVESDVPVLDTGMFEHMSRIAKLMASSSLVPTHLNAVRMVGGNEVAIEPNEAIANCFLVTNQAIRWRMDPFAVAQHVYVTKGRLGYEGKLIAAVINSRPAIEKRLSYEYSGEGESRKVIVSGKLKNETEVRTIEGTVAAWKTTGSNSPWGKISQWDQQLSYRGAREWARRHLPEAILGVLGDDELEEFQNAGRMDDLPAAADRSGSAKLKSALSAQAKNAEDAELVDGKKEAGAAPAAQAAASAAPPAGGQAPAAAPAAAAPAPAAEASPPAHAPAAPAAAPAAPKVEQKAAEAPKQPSPPPKKGEPGTPELKERFMTAFKNGKDSEVLALKRDEVNLFVWSAADLQELDASFRARIKEVG